MKAKFFILIIFLLICLCSYSQGGAQLRVIHPQIDTPDFTIESEPNTQVWHTGALSIPLDFTNGFKIIMTFTSLSQSMGEVPLLKLGGLYVQGSKNKFLTGYSITDYNTLLRTHRMYMLNGPTAKSGSYDTWDDTFIEPEQNYKLIFEIDETRIRINLLKGENPQETNTEYEFEGLSGTYLRDVLDGVMDDGFRSIVLSTDKRLKIRDIEIWTLDAGVYVPNPVTSQPFTAYLINKNSNLYMQPYQGGTKNGTQLVQDKCDISVWCLWEVTPLYNNKRLPTSFPAKLRNIQGNKYAVAKDASHEKYTPIIEWKDEDNDNSIWNITSHDKLQNKLTSGYAVVKDASTAPGANIIQWDTGTTDNASWNIFEAHWDSPIKDGYYKIRHAQSKMVIGVSHAPFVELLTAEGESMSGCEIYWHIEKQSSGAYRIRNLSMNKELVTDFLKYHSAYPYVYCASTEGDFGLVGTYLWYFKPGASNGYTIHQCHMEEILGAYYDPPHEGERVQLCPTTKGTSWNLEPINFHQPSLKGGLYKLKYAENNKYLVVKDASISSKAKVISYPTADTPNAWWYVEEIDSDGGYYIYNVNSSLALTIVPTGRAKSFAVQDGVLKGEKDPTQIWQIEHTSDNKYYLSDLRELRGLILPKEKSQQAHTFLYLPKKEWIFEPVNSTSATNRNSTTFSNEAEYILIPSTKARTSKVTSPERKDQHVTNSHDNIKLSDDATTLTVQSDKRIKNIELFNISGMLVQHALGTGYVSKIDIGKLNPEIYIVKVTMEDNTLSCNKFVKTK